MAWTKSSVPPGPATGRSTAPQLGVDLENRMGTATWVQAAVWWHGSAMLLSVQGTWADTARRQAMAWSGLGRGPPWPAGTPGERVASMSISPSNPALSLECVTCVSACVPLVSVIHQHQQQQTKEWPPGHRPLPPIASAASPHRPTSSLLSGYTGVLCVQADWVWSRHRSCRPVA